MKYFDLIVFSFLYFDFVFFPDIKIASQHYPPVSPLCPLPLIKNAPGHAIHLFLPYRTLLRTGVLQHRRNLCHGQRLLHWLRRRTPK